MVKTMRTIVQIFVAFSEKLNFKQIHTHPKNDFDSTLMTPMIFSNFSYRFLDPKNHSAIINCSDLLLFE